MYYVANVKANAVKLNIQGKIIEPWIGLSWKAPQRSSRSLWSEEGVKDFFEAEDLRNKPLENGLC